MVGIILPGVSHVFLINHDKPVVCLFVPYSYYNSDRSRLSWVSYTLQNEIAADRVFRERHRFYATPPHPIATA